LDFTWLDIVLVTLIAVGAIRGFMRGLIREGMAFGGLGVGLVLASQWYSEVAETLRPFVGGGGLLDGLSYMLVVLAVLSVATLLTVIITRVIRLLLVGWIDGVGGLLFGAAQGAVLATMLLVLMVKYPLAGLDLAVGDSGLAGVLLGAVPEVLDRLPPELASVAEFFGQ